ncbi:hypothetical protein Poli38472_011911 [Pythium oligandrum]|uniref:Uncharacterized protein n=1 Tax=Pythium oligandrum TaxID=41045 RepID=A0A8K1C8F0_PYTOL|nr:hypothetical protein Poli38472_011911 [Pythium oligandrum]|eukprot:TMW58323.1 hypothetical protein Poli38472_011911 [Pythium oligandrum]
MAPRTSKRLSALVQPVSKPAVVVAKRKPAQKQKKTTGEGKKRGRIQDQMEDAMDDEEDENMEDLDEDGDNDDEMDDDGAMEAETNGNDAAAPNANAEPEQPVKRKRGRRRLIHDEEQRKNRRKMQCKLNQRRYRARQRGMITTLSLEGEKLSEYIQELEAYHRFLNRFDRNGHSSHANEDVNRQRPPARSIWMDNRPLLVVKQFFYLFRHGFALHSVEISEIQEYFLRFAMDPSLISQGATTRGVDALILQLKRYSSYHAVFEMRMASFQVIHSPQRSDGYQDPTDGLTKAASTSLTWIIHVTGTLHLRLSRDTVMLIYPHIIENEALNSRVVGHVIDPTFSMVFHFNEASRVSKIEFMVDFAAAFMKLLKSTELTATLLERAIITPFCELGVDPHGDLDTAPKEKNKQLSLKFILL